MPADKKEIFETLSKIPVGDYVKHSKVEDYDGTITYLPYLPWQYAHLSVDDGALSTVRVELQKAPTA